MMRQEFEKLTGMYVTNDLYAAIEEAYYNFNGDKQDFCKAYKANQDGLAEKIRLMANRATWDAIQAKDKEIDELRNVLKSAQEKLELEQEWEPFEYKREVNEAQYQDSRHGADVMDIEWAKDFIANHYGFDRSKLEIVTTADVLETNRHGQVRKTGRKRDRTPFYGATDWYYVRFLVAGFAYEAYNDSMYRI